FVRANAVSLTFGWEAGAGHPPACDLGGWLAARANCSALLGREARRGNSLRSFVATLKQSRRVRQRSTRFAGAAARPALLDASHAPRSPRPRAFGHQGLAPTGPVAIS